MAASFSSGVAGSGSLPSGVTLPKLDIESCIISATGPSSESNRPRQFCLFFTVFVLRDIFLSAVGRVNIGGASFSKEKHSFKSQSSQASSLVQTRRRLSLPHQKAASAINLLLFLQVP